MTRRMLPGDRRLVAVGAAVVALVCGGALVFGDSSDTACKRWNDEVWTQLRAWRWDNVPAYSPESYRRSDVMRSFEARKPAGCELEDRNARR